MASMSRWRRVLAPTALTADRPMDFADATLVHAANNTGVSTVYTIDHDDSLTYRIDSRRRFRIVPDRW